MEAKEVKVKASSHGKPDEAQSLMKPQATSTNDWGRADATLITSKNNTHVRCIF
jgi:hypothetical protein